MSKAEKQEKLAIAMKDLFSMFEQIEKLNDLYATDRVRQLEYALFKMRRSNNRPY